MAAIILLTGTLFRVLEGAREFKKGWNIQVGPEAAQTVLVPIEPGGRIHRDKGPAENLVVEEPTITLGDRWLEIRGRVMPLEGGDLTSLWMKAVLVDRGVTFEQFSMIDQRTESWSVYFDLKRNLIPGDRLTLKATLLKDDDREIREIKRGISIESRGAPP